MPDLVDFPIRMTREIQAARKNVLVFDEHYNPDDAGNAGTAMNFTGYTVTGEVRVAKSSTSTKLCDVSFTNDLANGVIYAYLTAANATAILNGATETDAAGRKKAYSDIKAAPAGQDAEPWYILTLFVEGVVTA